MTPRTLAGSPVARASAALALAACLALNTFWLHTSNRAPDDAWISLRYAEHLVEGHGLRYNPGDERVEGFSSPLHVLLLAGLLAARVPAQQASQLSSILPAVALVALAAAWGARRLGGGWGLVAGLALALNPAVGMWARGGLETTLFALLVLAALAAAGEGRDRALAVVLGLLLWTRPEAPLYVVAAAGWLVVRDGGTPGAWRRALRVAGGAAAIYAPWLLFRIAYFQDVLPNTYYAKMDGVRSAQLQRGVGYLREFLRRGEVHVPLAVAAAAGAWHLARAGGGRARAAAGWPALAVAFGLAAVAFVLAAGGDNMAEQRFLLPVVPLLALLGAAGAARLAAAPAARGARAAAACALGFACLSQPVGIASHHLRHPTFPLDRAPALVDRRSADIVPRLWLLGRRLGTLLPPDAELALVPAGALPEAGRLRAIDMLGLNDRRLARVRVDDMGTRKQGHEKGDGALVLARRPAYVILNHNPNPRFDEASPPDLHLQFRPVRQIWESAEFQRDYAPFLVAIDDSTSFTIYERKGQVPALAGDGQGPTPLHR